MSVEKRTFGARRMPPERERARHGRLEATMAKTALVIGASAMVRPIAASLNRAEGDPKERGAPS
jgi:hypothetical protein